MKQSIENNLEQRVEMESRVTRLESRVKHIDDMVKNIQSHVTNHIPTKIDRALGQIDQLKQDFNCYKLYQSKWLVGILVALLVNIVVAIFRFYA